MTRIGCVLMLMLVGCAGQPEPEGSLVNLQGRNFEVHYDTLYVQTIEKTRPISIHDEINPKWKIRLQNGESFSSSRPYDSGATIITKTYVHKP